MTQQVDLRFQAMPPCPAAEDAARRRIRRLEARFPFVLCWRVTFERPPLAGDEVYVLRLLAQISGGALMGADAQGVDLQAVVRDAFRAIEDQLEEERQGARVQAARWLDSVRDRAALADAPR